MLCSSKTRAEIEMLQQDLGVAHPFVSENGGALFLPRRYFPFPISDGRSIAGYQAIEFGLPYYQLVETLHRVTNDLNIPVVGFSDMSTEEVAKDCKLPLMVALLAKLREYDEPFRILDSGLAVRSRLFKALHRAGLHFTRGGALSPPDRGHRQGPRRSDLEVALQAGLGQGCRRRPGGQPQRPLPSSGS